MGTQVAITGASSGIGEAAARHLAARGLRVFGTSRRERTPSPDEDGIEWLALDVCSDASVDAFARALEERCPALDGLVCNAGFGIYGSVEEVAIEAARAQFETNYFGVLRVLGSLLPGMRARGRGRVVLVGSLAGRAPIPFQSHYSASKAAIEATAMALHNELHGTGVHVALVEPGDISTPFNDAMDWGAAEGSAYGERIARVEKTIRESLPKAPGPERVARAIEHALTAPKPRVRYPVGNEVGLVSLGKRLLSDGLNLGLLRRHFGL